MSTAEVITSVPVAHTWINPYSLMIKVIPGAGVLESTQNYYYYDYKESTELVAEYSKLLPQAESLVQLHYTHLMPIVTRANDIFIRSLLKPVNQVPDLSDSRIIAICIIRDSENIRFMPRGEITCEFASGLVAGELWTEVIANYPVINEDYGLVPGFLQPTMATRGYKQFTDSQETINSLVAQMNRASESYNIGRIELDKMTSESLAKGDVRSHVSDKFYLVAEPIDGNGTVDTGFLAQCRGTDVSLNSRPPGVCLELSVNGNQIKVWDSIVYDNKITSKQHQVSQLRAQYDMAVHTLRTECAIQDNLNRFADGAVMEQVINRLQNPASHPDDTNQLVLCFLGKYIEKCTIREAKQIGVYNPEYLKFMSGLLEKGYHILPMNIEVTVTKNIVTPHPAMANTTHRVIENQEYSYRSRIARVASIVNVESIQFSSEPIETTYTQCTTANDSSVTQMTSKYITTALLIW